MPIIPFYGAEHPDLFALERAAMDRQGSVLSALDDLLPTGLVADVGAGDGYLAEWLTTNSRYVIPVEPAAGMIDRRRALPWIRADAEALPFRTDALDGIYATWAYFFTRGWDPTPGIAEAERVVRPGGTVVVVDNLGADEFTALSDRNISADAAFWTERGFECREVETAFEFDSMDDARTLLGFYFGDEGRRRAQLTLGFRVGVFIAHP